MNINTRDGIEIYVLPENAKCTRTGKSPLEMEKCPLCEFDDYGEECVPDVCEFYTEEDRKMKVEEAALHLERLYGIVSEEYKRALDVVDDAFFKQVAKKPVKIDDNLDLCPACMCGFGVKIVDNYCSYCGQKLDWSEEEEE